MRNEWTCVDLPSDINDSCCCSTSPSKRSGGGIPICFQSVEAVVDRRKACAHGSEFIQSPSCACSGQSKSNSCPGVCSPLTARWCDHSDARWQSTGLEKQVVQSGISPRTHWNDTPVDSNDFDLASRPLVSCPVAS